MTPQGLVIMVVVVVGIVCAFVYDKKKADKIREDYDKRFDGKHVCDFSNIYYNGFIAENTLVLKERVKGYLLVDLKKVKTIRRNTSLVNGVQTTYVAFCDENGKKVDDSSKIKPMSPNAAEELINEVIKHADWITLA